MLNGVRMSRTISAIDRQDLLVTIILIACISMIFSPFVLSITMWLIPAIGLFAWQPGQKWYMPRLSERALRFQVLARKNIPLAALTGLFFLVLASAWQTEDWPYWWERLRIRLPFLILPVSGILLPSLPNRHMKAILALLLGVMVVTCIGIGVNYLLNLEAIQAGMLRGKPIPVPRNHIRFSLLLAISLLGGLYLMVTEYRWRWTWERPVYLAGTAFLFFMLHVLSVRTGILAFYAALVVLSIHYAYRLRKLWIPFVLTGLLAGLVWSGYTFLPSFRSKMDYMRYDLSMYLQGEGGLYADAGRIVSLETGWKIFAEHPVFGVGVGNLRREVNRIFATDHPEFVESLTPHNQFLYVMAGTGLIGLLIFLVCLYLPVIMRRHDRSPLLLAFYGILTTTFLLEHSIENSIGAGITSIFLMVLLIHERDDH